MSSQVGYLAGSVLVCGAALAFALFSGPAIQTDLLWGVGLAASIQIPLGWFTVRSVGTNRFQLVWSAGMLARLAIVALTALVLVPANAWRVGSVLGALVATLVALLLVEAVTAMREHAVKRHDGATSYS
jgi:O-antigen/teichoic acid export membrane protein